MIISSTSKRPGNVAPLTALLLPMVMIPMLAFAVDLGYILRAQSELQNAADAAALAGAGKLIDANFQHYESKLYGSTVSAPDWDAAVTSAKSEAKKFGDVHLAGDLNKVGIQDGDIQVGYIEDSTKTASDAKGIFRTDTVQKNAVKVTVRRDSQTSPLGLFFTRVFSITEATVSADATAMLPGPSTGFSGPATTLLPIALKLNLYQKLVNNDPSGTQDSFTVDLTANPPVSSGKDNKVELNFYPDAVSPGEFGLLNLKNEKTSSSAEISNWIQNGMSAADLATWGGSGLNAPLNMDGQTGIEATQNDVLSARIGQPVTIPVYDTQMGTGTGNVFHVVGWMGAVIVDVDLMSGSKKIVIQLNRTIDSGAAAAATPPDSSGPPVVGSFPPLRLVR